MIIFRADASIDIGIGHVMRCLRLAKTLTEQYGIDCEFICTDHKGNSIEYIKKNGFSVKKIIKSNFSKELENDESKRITYYKWLGANWKDDAEQTKNAIKGKKVDWLIIDHYAIDKNWETALRPYTKKIMVIDDLADREHNCDILLDQNLVKNFKTRYKDLLPKKCSTLLGPQYALISDEYKKMRISSSSRSGKINRILVSFGGSDQNNFTKLTISTLIKLNIKNLIIDVVIDFNSLHIIEIKKLAKKNTNIFLYDRIPSLATLMSKADLSIGAGGSTTWERCCLGIPSIIIVCAINQGVIANAMESEGAAIVIKPSLKLEKELKNAVIFFLNDSSEYLKMSKKAFSICDGKGINRVIDNLL